MEHNRHFRAAHGGDAVIEALLAPESGSFVDALLALGDEAAPQDDALRALNGGLQAALARRMRSTIGKDAA